MAAPYRVPRAKKVPAKLKDKLLLSMTETGDVNVKVRVRCNQTGKVFVTSISSLEDKDCNPVTQRQVQEGLSFIWVDGGNGSGYPVTIMKILVPGGKENSAPKQHLPALLSSARKELTDRPLSKRPLSRAPSPPAQPSPESSLGSMGAGGYMEEEWLSDDDMGEPLHTSSPNPKIPPPRRQTTHPATHPAPHPAPMASSSEPLRKRSRVEYEVSLEDEVRDLRRTVEGMDRRLKAKHHLLTEMMKGGARVSDVVEDEKYIYNGHNLLKVHAKDAGSFARALLDILFTKKEQMGKCVLRSPLNVGKPLLDQDRVYILFKCLDQRYSLSDKERSAVISSLKQKCRDASKKKF